MKQNTKIWLITFGIFFILAAIVVSGFFIGKAILNNRNDKAFDDHIAQAKVNITALLAEKYPDRTFEFINVKCDPLEEGIAVTRAPKYSNDVWFEIQDNHGNIYVARSDTSLTGQAGIDASQDNVQTEEIQAAIGEYLEDMLGLDAEYMKSHSRYGAMYYLYHEKFDGDIVAFAEKASEKNVYFELYISNKTLDMDKIFKENTSFFKLFEDILVVDSKAEITTDRLRHLVFNIGLPEIVIPEYAIFVNHVYIFDEEYQLIKQESKPVEDDGIYYVYPYHEFDEDEIEMEKTDIEDVSVGIWMESIGELETQTGEVYSNVTPITGLHYGNKNIACFIPFDKSTLEDGQTLLLLTWLSSFAQDQHVAYELRKYEGFQIMGDYIYVAAMNQGVKWTIAKVDLGDVPVRVNPDFSEDIEQDEDD